MLPIPVPALVQPAAEAPVPLAVAIERLLDRYDRAGEGRPLHAERVRPADQPALAWLLQALTRDLPANPFPRGSAAHAEAEAVRALLAGGGTPARLAALPLQEAGSPMALWRWGRRLDRAGRLPKPLRKALEDTLLAQPEPGLAGAYALRHALCFALAEGDLDRFARLKADHGADAAATFLDFQRLFALLGSPGPVLRLWSLPALQPVQKHLQELGGRRIWICPAGAADPAPPADVAWVIPSAAGVLAEATPAQETKTRQEAEALGKRIAAPARTWIAPARDDLEAAGLTLFPVLIELDAGGLITALRMGEAAPALLSPARRPAGTRSALPRPAATSSGSRAAPASPPSGRGGGP